MECSLLGNNPHFPFKGKGTEILSDLSVNPTSLRLTPWPFLHCKGSTGYAFSMRSFQNQIPTKLYFTHGFELDLTRNTSTKT